MLWISHSSTDKSVLFCFQPNKISNIEGIGKYLENRFKRLSSMPSENGKNNINPTFSTRFQKLNPNKDIDIRTIINLMERQ